MAEAMSKGEKGVSQILGLAGELSGLYEVVINRGGVLKEISLGKLRKINWFISEQRGAVKEFDAVSSNTVFEFKFHLTLRKLYQQVIGIDSADMPHLKILTDYPQYSQIRNIVYFGEADDGYVIRALTEFIRHNPDIISRVTLSNEKSVSVKLTLPEIKKFLCAKGTLTLAKEEGKQYGAGFSLRGLRRGYTEKLINKKIGKLQGQKFDVIIAVSNASREQIAGLKSAMTVPDDYLGNGGSTNSRLGASLSPEDYRYPPRLTESIPSSLLNIALDKLELEQNYPHPATVLNKDSNPNFVGFYWARDMSSAAAIIKVEEDRYALALDENLRERLSQLQPDSIALFLYLLAVHEGVELTLQLQGATSDINTEIAAELLTIDAYSKLTPEERALAKQLYQALEEQEQFKGRYLAVIGLYDAIIKEKASQSKTIDRLAEFISQYPKEIEGDYNRRLVRQYMQSHLDETRRKELLQELKKLMSMCHVSSVQSEYNLFDRTAEDDLLPFCQENP
jgi:hypothetical protein